MTIIHPVSAPTNPPPVLDPGDTRASVVTETDLVAEFGATYPISQAMLDAATAHVEDHLRRPLRNAVYTHRLRIIYDGWVDAVFGAAGAVRPPAIPVQQVVAPGGTQIIDNVEVRYAPPDDIMLGFWGYTWVEQFCTLTYQGGWDHETLPSPLRTVILKVAVRMLQRTAPGSLMDAPTPGVANPRAGDAGFSTTPLFGGLFDETDMKVMKGYKYHGDF